MTKDGDVTIDIDISSLETVSDVSTVLEELRGSPNGAATTAIEARSKR